MGDIDASSVTDNLLEPIFAVDTNGDIAYANDRFLEITDLSGDDVDGADIDLLEQFVAEGFGDVQDGIAAVSRGTSDEQRVVLSMRHPHSAPVPRRLKAEARVSPIIQDGERSGGLVTLRDVTEREERRRELKRQNERLDEFVKVVSHDLRNPLNVATARLELATDECDSTHLPEVGTALERMDHLIDDLLTVAREGKQVEETEEVTLSELSETCWANVNTDGATLVIEGDRSQRANPSRLKQLLENLIRNALEHGGEDVTIKVGEMPDGFYVADDGQGIPEEERERVFDAGYSTTDDGTGFGLNIVQETANAHGWDISVTESEDGGTRFEITGVASVE